MKTIWKHTIRVGEVVPQLWAPGTKIVHFDTQPNDMERANDDSRALRFWVEHNPSLAGVGRGVNLYVYPTGGHIPDHFQHVGTAIDGRYVWHLYAEYL